MTTVMIDPENKYLPCVLTKDERDQRALSASEAAEKADLARARELDAKKVMRLAKEDAEAHEATAAQLLRVYRSGRESRYVEVQREYNPTTNAVTEVRMDTGEVLITRPASPEESTIGRQRMQTTLPGDLAPRKSGPRAGA